MHWFQIDCLLDRYYAVFLHAYAEGSCFTTIPLTLIIYYRIILATLTALARISGSVFYNGLLVSMYLSFAERHFLYSYLLFSMVFQLLILKLFAYTAAVVGFSLNVGAYASEIIRASILSIPKAAGSSLHNWDDISTSIKTCYFTSNARINSTAFEYIY